MSKAQRDVYHVWECSLLIPGVGSMPVSSFTLLTRQNHIPTLEVSVDPFHEISGDKTPDAEVASMEVFIRKYQSIQQVIVSKSRTASFYCSILCENAQHGGRPQTLFLFDWVVIGAGFLSTASGGLVLRIKIAHPAHKLTETTANFFGTKAKSNAHPTDFDGTSDVLDGIKKGMQLYHQYMSGEGVTGVLKKEKEFTDALKSYEQARTHLSQHIEWKSDGDGWPRKPFSGQLKKEVPFTIWNYVTSIGESTFWSWLSNKICNQYHLSITPTFWKPKLELGPVLFWGAPKVTVTDIHIMQFELPPSDPMPLKGVYCIYCMSTDYICTTLNGSKGMKEVVSDGMMHTESELSGVIVGASVPDWFNSLIRNSSGRNTQSTTLKSFGNDMTTPMNSSSSEGGAGEPQVELFAEKRKAVKELCKQQFTEMFRSNMDISLRCTLMMQHDYSTFEQQFVTAGAVFRVLPDSTFLNFMGPSPGLVDFYATEVVHHVDCSAGAAYTNIRGGFIHETNGPSGLTAIEGGVAPNYMY